jgi:hypothetical protein
MQVQSIQGQAVRNLGRRLSNRIRRKMGVPGGGLALECVQASTAMQCWLEKNLTKANYMELRELFQPLDGLDREFSSFNTL